MYAFRKFVGTPSWPYGWTVELQGGISVDVLEDEVRFE
jgi:hypothetical protein